MFFSIIKICYGFFQFLNLVWPIIIQIQIQNHNYFFVT